MSTKRVFIHGVPESAAIWEPLLKELAVTDDSEVVLLSPPGFGVPLPAGFGATFAEYRAWLIDELSRLAGPVDLVGHDFGGVHVLAVAMERPDLLRSWVSDVVGVFDPDYVWHPLAKIWQTPGDGERQIAGLLSGSVADRAARMVQIGLLEPAASKVAAVQNEDMGRAILSLYRSARQPFLAELGRELDKVARRPGLAIIPTEDHAVGTLEQRKRAAQRAGARVEILDGLGHWWLLQDPARGARVLADFWSKL